ncbi:MAG: 3-methyl-2-oxobutanoate hydroxymethyltransferase, partial [Actinobacteria bacterium]|nr:3-methyl-2-oxobutanoate hydroxymethyltransferase [Actinomycetota bacterium]
MIEALVSAEIPVMGHLGLTPQSVNVLGGFRVQAKNVEDAAVLIEDAQLLEKAGVFAIVLEGIPDVAARLVTESIDVPTIGIGAGPHTDGQVLVFHDLVGLENGVRPKFVRRYAELAEDATKAVSAYASDVRSGLFPNQSETYHASSAVTEEISIYGSKLNS